MSDTEEVVGSVLVPNTAPEEAKTKRGGDCDDDVKEEDELEVEVEGRERRTASRRFIVPRTFVRIPERKEMKPNQRKKRKKKRR